MKLRIHRQDLRFRLSPKDLEILRTEDQLSQHLQLSPEQRWSYELRLNPATDTTAFHGAAAQATVELPARQFRAWIDSPEIEWAYQQASPPLQITVEKDLKPKRG